METGRPANLELSLANTAGTRVVQLETETGQEKAQSCKYLFCSVLLVGLEWLRL